MGKTAFALNIAETRRARQGLPVVVFSMEMGAAQLALRLVGSLGRIDQQHLRTGKLADDEWGAWPRPSRSSANVQMYIDETPALTVARTARACAAHGAQFGGTLGLIVIDYLQLMSGNGGSEENRATEISAKSRAA
jgi:replicative DNA helicase